MISLACSCKSTRPSPGQVRICAISVPNVHKAVGGDLVSSFWIDKPTLRSVVRASQAIVIGGKGGKVLLDGFGAIKVGQLVRKYDMPPHI